MTGRVSGHQKPTVAPVTLTIHLRIRQQERLPVSLRDDEAAMRNVADDVGHGWCVDGSKKLFSEVSADRSSAR
jgi:hypothetical protein